MILVQEKKGDEIAVERVEDCIECGHCVAVCPVGAVEHSVYPVEKVHSFDVGSYPTSEQLMLLCKGRRSNRAFSSKPIPEEWLDQILEAAHRAPTAVNAQDVAFTLVTDPEKLRQISEFTLKVFGGLRRKIGHPLLKPFLQWMKADALRYIPVFDRLLGEYERGNDLILRKATAVLFIHTPSSSLIGSVDGNLAYQNGSLMAECLGVSQFYTGFVCMAIQQEGKGSLEKALGIEGTIRAGMALGIPDFRYPNYMDRREMELHRL